jgi:hypothetical protein
MIQLLLDDFVTDLIFFFFFETRFEILKHDKKICIKLNS